MAVSDGGGWTDPCLDTERGMSPSDRQVWLANFVLDTLRKEGWQGRVAIQAYNECALAPSIRVDPCVIVVAMIRNGPDQLHYDEVVAGYRGAGATTIYPYEYVCVAPWNEGTPAPSHANHPEMMVTLAERIRAVGVGWAEACQQWCSSGRGYWVLSRLLDGLNPPSLSLARQLQDEYLNLAYGLAASAMGSYHATMDAMTSKPSDAEIAKLFSDLHAAWAVADAPVRRRLLDHFCYARYLQLYRADKQQKTLESFAALLRHVYRIEVTDCVPIMPLMAITWKTEVADLSRSLGYPADEPIRPRRSPWNDAPPTADEALGWGKP